MVCSRWLRAATTVVSSSSAFSRDAAIRIGMAALNSRIASASRRRRIKPIASVPRAAAVSKWLLADAADLALDQCSAPRRCRRRSGRKRRARECASRSARRPAGAAAPNWRSPCRVARKLSAASAFLRCKFRMPPSCESSCALDCAVVGNADRALISSATRPSFSASS